MMIFRSFKTILGSATHGLSAVTVFLTAMLAGTHAAFAQITLGDMICNASTNIYTSSSFSIANLLDGISYIAGAALIGHGLIGLKEHAENPSKPPLHQAIARIAGGTGLLALPSFAYWLVQSFFGVSSIPGDPGAGYACPGGGPVTGGSGITLDVLMDNLVSNIVGLPGSGASSPFLILMSVAAITYGVFLIIRGLIKASKHGTDPNAYSIPKILTSLIVGTILVTVGQSLNMILTTLFGTDSTTPASDVLNWNIVQELNAGTQFTTAIIAALTFFQMIGIIAFVRGWMIVKNAAENVGQATMVQGFTHIIGGVLAINIYGFLEIIDKTFGTNMLL
jgi:hypothetical protein